MKKTIRLSDLLKTYMILSANKNTKEFNKTLTNLVGKKFSLLERIRMGGIGSGKLIVSEYSTNLQPCFGNQQDTKFVIAEVCEKGLIIYIKNAINDYVWLIPYYQLSLFKSTHYSIHSNGNFVKVDLKSLEQQNNMSFIKKLEQLRMMHLTNHDLR